MKPAPLPSLTIRHPQFHFQSAPENWISNPIHLEFLEALSLFVPTSERFVIELMRKQDTLASPLKERVKAFIKQEGHHSAAHRAANLCILQKKPELSWVSRAYSIFLKGFEKLAPKSMRLAAPVAFEHFTSAISKDILVNQTKWINQQENDAVDFVVWHSLEELEHQSVCLEVYRSKYSTNLPIFISILLAWLPLTLSSIFIIQAYCLLRRGTILNPKHWLPYIRFTASIMRLSATGLTDYLRHDFNGWRKGDTVIYENALRQFIAKRK